MNTYATFTMSKRTVLVFILIFTMVVVFDSTIVYLSSYSGVEFPTWLHMAIFITFCTIFSTSNTILVNSVRKLMSQGMYASIWKNIKYFHVIIGVTIAVTVAIMLVIIFQMVLLNKYSLILLSVETYLSHISALVFLSCLAILFSRWLTKKRNYTTILYSASFLLASINLIVSLTYLDSYLTSSRFRELPYVTPYHVGSYVTQLQGLPFTESLSVAFDALSISSFLLMWIATAISMIQYSHKLGKIKYFVLMSIPLMYYIFPLQGYFGDAFFSLLQSSPIFYSVTYIMIFSATKQVGALLFSLSFWSASSLVFDDRVRKLLLMSSIGVAVLFGSLQIAPLQYHVYPPYGLVTEAFLPIGSYLLFVGIFISAKGISRDSELRKYFYKSAASQLTLLKSIGVSEMEKELEEKITFVSEHAPKVSSEGVEDEPLDYENAKEILREVLNELYYSEGKEQNAHKS